MWPDTDQAAGEMRDGGGSIYFLFYVYTNDGSSKNYLNIYYNGLVSFEEERSFIFYVQ